MESADLQQPVKKPSKPIDTVHVDVLDGVRAAAILIVMWYHIWQQSWLMPIWETPALYKFGITCINLDQIPRTGYLFVDMMLLLSGFCLFLPHARAMQGRGAVPRVWDFYKKRLVRIVPCYALSTLIIFFAWALPSGAYSDTAFAVRDLLANLTFTQMFSANTYLGTQLNGVLWTVAVEMQFYLIFPLLAKAFRKQPILTYLGMVTVSELYLRLLVHYAPDSLRMTLNQLPGYLEVFATGMLGAWLLTKIAAVTERRWFISVPCTLGFFGCLYGISRVELAAASASVTQIFQAEYRLPIALLFLLTVLTLALSVKAVRWLFTNKLACFLAGISYNLYIWHQWLAVRLKYWRIPAWEGDELPNMTDDTEWMWKYTLVCIGAALLAAVLATYLVEKPIARALRPRGQGHS